MRLFLVRHGESEANRAGTLDGYGDAALTEPGRAQAAQLATQASNWNVRNARLVTSPMQRARHTADALAAALALSPSEDRRLTAGEGRVSLEIEAAGAEVASAIEDAWRHDGDLIAVSHRFPMLALLSRFYTRPVAQPLMDQIGNCDAIEIARRDGGFGAPVHLRLAR
jgi:phosphohistidine phosphatase SixA